MLSLLVDGGFWFQVAACVAALAAGAVFWRKRTLPSRVRVLATLTTAYGCVMAGLGTGHVAAIAIKRSLGTLQPIAWWVFPLGFAIALPALWLVVNGCLLRTLEGPIAKQTLVLHAIFALALLPSGPSAVLSIFAIMNVAMQLLSRRAIERGVIAATLVAYTGMLVASFFVPST